MGLFVLRRLLWTAPVLLVVLTLVFFGTRAIGGDPLRPGPLAGVGSSGGFFKRGDPKPQAIQDNMTRKFMLHRPWYEQYGYYLEGVARLDLGRSMSYPERSVRDVIAGLAPRSFLLGALAAAIAAAVGVP